MVYTVFSRFLRFDPSRPDWVGRDRFILSPGHGSALLYSVLHLFGYDLSLDDLKQFRQLGSKTPGHPESFMAPGVECTTGPLGQGFANGVGMAIASRWMTARYGELFNHTVYAVVSDGDLMEGVAVEAASLAGHLGLGNLVYLYDSNDICLDGETGKTYTEDVTGKFAAMGWQVLHVEDGNDVEAIARAVDSAKGETSRPSLVIVKTVIGFGSPVAGSSKSHGAPLGQDGVLSTKRSMEYGSMDAFWLPDGFGDVARESRNRGELLSNSWDEQFAGWSSENPDLAMEVRSIGSGTLPDGWDSDLSALRWEDGSVATRDSGHAALNAIASKVPWLVGGGADLASSTKALIKGGGDFDQSVEGRNIWFGVREHAMGAIVNGMAHAGLRPFGSTFLVFSDYMRGSLRLAALSKLSSLFIFSHDSVFVGEDGPTHQPIEHVESLRLIPGMAVYRPADALETVECYRLAVERGRAACLILTRQGVPVLNQYADLVQSGCAKGGYLLVEKAGAQATLVATGSEVSLALAAAALIAEKGVSVNVASIPCRELFLAQPSEYQAGVLGGGLIVALEAGRGSGWSGIANPRVSTVTIDRFGESGPGQAVYEHLQMTPDHVVESVLARLGE
jgi:transketolase